MSVETGICTGAQGLKWILYQYTAAGATQRVEQEHGLIPLLLWPGCWVCTQKAGGYTAYRQSSLQLTMQPTRWGMLVTSKLDVGDKSLSSRSCSVKL